MAYPAEQIIAVTTRINAAGLGTSNFGAGMFFSDFDSSSDNTFTAGSYRDYGSSSDVSNDFDESSDPYLASVAWFDAIPKPLTLRIYMRATGDTPLQSFNKAVQAGIWFYWFDFETSIRATQASVLALASAADSENKFFAFTTNEPAVRDPSLITDIVSKAVAQGNRRMFILDHATAPFAGFELAAVFSRVNFNVTDSAITGNLKKLPGIVAENLNRTAYSTMETKGAVFYTTVETGGKVDNGRIINSVTTSTYGEFIDDVFNLDGFVNFLTVSLYNALANADSKLKQTPSGQHVINDAAMQVGEQFIANGYLGDAEYADDATGKTMATRGYILLTKPEDILKISPEQKKARYCAPIRMRLYRAGAIHAVDVTVDVV